MFLSRIRHPGTVKKLITAVKFFSRVRGSNPAECPLVMGSEKKY